MSQPPPATTAADILQQIQDQAQLYQDHTDAHTSAIGYTKKTQSGATVQVCAPNTLLTNATRYKGPKTMEEIEMIPDLAKDPVTCLFALTTFKRCSSKTVNNVCTAHLEHILNVVPMWGKSTGLMALKQYTMKKPFLLTMGNMMVGQPIEYYRDNINLQTMNLSPNDAEIMAAFLYYLYHADNQLEKTNNYLYQLTSSAQKIALQYHKVLDYTYIDIAVPKTAPIPVAVTQFVVTNQDGLIINTVTDGVNTTNIFSLPLNVLSTIDIALLTAFMGPLCDSVLVPNTYISCHMIFAGTGYGVEVFKKGQHVGSLHKTDSNKDAINEYYSDTTPLMLPVRCMGTTTQFKVVLGTTKPMSLVEQTAIHRELQTINRSIVACDQPAPTQTPLPTATVPNII